MVNYANADMNEMKEYSPIAKNMIGDISRHFGSGKYDNMQEMLAKTEILIGRYHIFEAEHSIGIMKDIIPGSACFLVVKLTDGKQSLVKIRCDCNMISPYSIIVKE